MFTYRLTEERKRTNYDRIYIEINTRCKYPESVTVVVNKKEHIVCL